MSPGNRRHAVPYLSVMLGKRIREANGELMGRLSDVVVEPSAKFPVVKGIEVNAGRGRGRRRFYVPWNDIREWRDECVVARIPEESAAPVGGVYLARDLLDKQMVDMDGYKIVRVSDIRLAWSGGSYA